MKQFIFLFISGFFLACGSDRNQKGKAISNIAVFKSIDRQNYYLQFLSDWDIDTTSEGYDIDSRFSIKSPMENAMAMFFIFNTSIDEAEFTNGQVKAQLDQTVKGGQVLNFDHWGSFSGRGALVEGNFLGIMPGKIKIFCHSGDSVSFLVVSQCLNKYEEKMLPGFEVIETSFKLKK